MLSSLPNNRLILNGHRIFSLNQLFDYCSKRLKSEITDEKSFFQVLNRYRNLKIAVWHGDTFLQEENAEAQGQILKLLNQCGEVKVTKKLKS